MPRRGRAEGPDSATPRNNFRIGVSRERCTEKFVKFSDDRVSRVGKHKKSLWFADLPEIVPRARGLLGVESMRRRLRAKLGLFAGFFAALVLVSRAASADPSTTSPEQGFDLGEVQHPRSVAMGGARTALGSSTNALWGNPANLPLSRVYHFEALGAWGPEARRQSYGGAVVDSSTNRLAGGFGGVWNITDPNGMRRQWTDLRLTLAYPLIDKLSVGVTGRYLRVNQSVSSGPLGDSLVSGGTRGEAIFNTATIDLGVTLAPIEGLRIGAVGKNLTNPGTGVAPTLFMGGIGYQTGIVSVEAEGVADFTTYGRTAGRVMLGAEVFVAEHVPLRAGYRFDEALKVHSVSGGAGYVDRRWSIELGIRRDVSATYPSTFASLALRYFYDSGGSDAGPEM